jgi:NAD(P)-dependent dehydrogenase (short-subunit alcohol dehydrogenase family)
MGDLTNLEGRLAVITGASRGIGKGLAEVFAERGMKLGLCARSACGVAGAEQVTERIDVTEPGALAGFCEQVAATFGPIDLWINNAGVLEPVGPLRSVSSSDFAHHLDINLMGVFEGTQAYVNHVRERAGGGVLVNMSSGAAQKGYAGWSAYCASKGAVDRLTECVALEEEAVGLRAHAVAPGVVDTHMQELIRACGPERFPMVERFRKMKARESFNSPRWVAEHILELVFGPEGPGRPVVIRLPNEVD